MAQLEGFFSLLDVADAAPVLTLRTLIMALLLSFVLGQGIAWVYHHTHTGLSYSRGFTQSLVVLAMIATVVMSVIGNNVVAAFGLIGALAVIRFRNVLKDTRDTCFVFLTLVLGMAIGSHRFAVALIAGAILMLVSTWLHFTRFGTRGIFDGHISYRSSHSEAWSPEVKRLFARHCRRQKAVTTHDSGDELELVYQVRLRNRQRGRDFAEELRAAVGIHNVALVLRDDMAEL